MAVFEKDRGSRRYFSQSTDPFPVPEGGVPSGSMLVYTDTGERLIYDGDSRVWLPFVGEEDIIEVMEQVRDGIYDLLAHVKVTRAAVTTIANTLDEGSNFSTDDE